MFSGETGLEEEEGGGVMIYIKEHIRCKQIEWSCDNELECIGLNVTLSSQMSFTLIRKGERGHLNGRF